MPTHYYEGALALGATHERSIFTVVIPAAKSEYWQESLGIGRAIGETMAVIMIVGNQPRIAQNILQGMRTLTGNIVLEMDMRQVCTGSADRDRCSIICVHPDQLQCSNAEKEDRT